MVGVKVCVGVCVMVGVVVIVDVGDDAGVSVRVAVTVRDAVARGVKVWLGDKVSVDWITLQLEAKNNIQAARKVTKACVCCILKSFMPGL